MLFRVAIAISSTAVAVAALAAGGAAKPLPNTAWCKIFPADNAWNQRVDRLPVAGNSNALIRSMGLRDEVHTDFGSGTWDGGPIGIPFTTVSSKQRKVPVSFDYPDESDRGRYPIPRNAPIEGGRRADGDRHVLVVDRSRCKLYEIYDARPIGGGKRWKAGSGAIWNLRSNKLRPEGWTSADAAGLPILPGLARYDEVARGEIDHALRFTTERTRKAFVYPARHFASNSNDPSLPPMGLRVRLKSNIDVDRFDPQARVIARALQRYGMILADNGSNWYVSGAPSPKWNNDDLRGLDVLRGENFEVVDTRSMPRPGL